MKITLIYPETKADEAGLQEPLGLLYIASVLRKEGHDIYLIDLTFDSINAHVDQIKNSKLVAFSSTTQLFNNAVNALIAIKKINPEVISLIGGTHPSIRWDECLEKGFDYAIVGEAENTIKELAQKLENPKDLEKIEGLAYKEDKKFKVNKKCTFIHDLDSIPFPARDLWDYKRYFKAGAEEFGILATRGCPYNCFYCKPMVNNIFGKTMRKRSPENVVSEIKEVVENYKDVHKGKPYFWFRDDTFTYCGAEWFKKFRDEIKKNNIKITWACHSRVDAVNEEMWGYMKESGLIRMSFGVESGSQKILNFYRKGTTIKQTIAAFDMCRKLGIETFAYFMVGAPDETKEDLEMSYNLIKRIKPDNLEIYTVVPYPGNDLYDYVKKNDLLLADNNPNFSYWNKNLPIKTKYLTKDDISKFKRRVYRYKNMKMLTNYATSWKNLRKFIKYLARRREFVYKYFRRSL